jgi:dolichol kinase
MTSAQRRKLNKEYWGSLVGATAIVLFGFVISRFEVPPMGYYWASLFTIITATGRRIYDALDIIHAKENS